MQQRGWRRIFVYQMYKIQPSEFATCQFVSKHEKMTAAAVKNNKCQSAVAAELKRNICADIFPTATRNIILISD